MPEPLLSPDLLADGWEITEHYQDNDLWHITARNAVRGVLVSISDKVNEEVMAKVVERITGTSWPKPI